MPKTTSIYARMEPEIKEQAEIVLNKLGIPMSNAINIFLRQIVLQNGLPFEVKIAPNGPVAFGNLREEEFNYEIKKGFDDLITPHLDSFAINRYNSSMNVKGV